MCVCVCVCCLILIQNEMSTEQRDKRSHVVHPDFNKEDGGYSQFRIKTRLLVRFNQDKV